jgi:hypothetical protein
MTEELNPSLFDPDEPLDDQIPEEELADETDEVPDDYPISE